MPTVIKFYHDSGQDVDALLERAEREINTALDKKLPPGAKLRAIVPQFARQENRVIDLLVTVTFDVSDSTNPSWLNFRLREKATTDS